MSTKLGLLQPHQNYVRRTTELWLVNRDAFPAVDGPSDQVVIGVDRFEYQGREEEASNWEDPAPK